MTISFNEKEWPISKIPFPTVAICPDIKTMKEKLDMKEVFSLSKSEIDQLPGVK